MALISIEAFKESGKLNYTEVIIHSGHLDEEEANIKSLKLFPALKNGNYTIHMKDGEKECKRLYLKSKH